MITLKVTGVMRDLPHNTQLTGDVFIPNTSLADRHFTRITSRIGFNQNGYGYVRLAPGADPAKRGRASMAPHARPRRDAGR